MNCVAGSLSVKILANMVKSLKLEFAGGSLRSVRSEQYLMSNKSKLPTVEKSRLVKGVFSILRFSMLVLEKEVKLVSEGAFSIDRSPMVELLKST